MEVSANRMGRPIFQFFIIKHLTLLQLCLFQKSCQNNTFHIRVTFFRIRENSISLEFRYDFLQFLFQQSIHLTAFSGFRNQGCILLDTYILAFKSTLYLFFQNRMCITLTRNDSYICCGKHYVLSFNVTSLMQRTIVFHNFLRRRQRQ